MNKTDNAVWADGCLVHFITTGSLSIYFYHRLLYIKSVLYKLQSQFYLNFTR